MWEANKPLRKEVSENCSGTILKLSGIPFLKESDYHVKSFPLDGAAPKEFIRAYFYEEGKKARKAFPRTWTRYIAKTAEKWYPHESVIEYMINRIGQILGLNMNNIRLVRANGQIRFLSEYFLNPSEEQLIHGADICGQHLNDVLLAKEIADNISTARDLFTFQFVEQAIIEVFPSAHSKIIVDFVKMLTLDAITGNNDRHFYNWGVIDNIKKKKSKPRFSPIFDSARGLFWNWDDLNIALQRKNAVSNGKKIENYIEKACPRISLETNKKANHFQLIEFLKNSNRNYNVLIEELSSEKNEARVLKMLREEFYSFFSFERRELTTYILNHRFAKIRRL